MPWLIAIATVALHLVCIDQYGYFRDELYYLACSEHLAWGYVDQPPLIALIAFVVRHTLGESLLAIRLLPALAGGALVLLTSLLARQMGGNRYAQSLAALTAMIVPVYLAVAHFLSMNVFEPLLWMGAVSVAVSIFNGASPKRWLWFGALAGLGLQNKHATLFFGLAFFLALVLTNQRRHLRSVWIWLGGAVAFLIFLPNLVWQAQHDFATVELLQNIANSNKNAPVTPLSFIGGQFLLMNPITAPIWIAGLVWLFRSSRYRALGWCFVTLAVEFIVLKGKVYYMSPAFPMLLAAGGIAVSAARQAWRVTAVIAVVVAGAILVPMALPILPVETFIRYQSALGIEPPATETHRKGALPQQYADMFGWPEMAAVVARAYNSLTPAERATCAIFGQNYGQAGAIDFFGKQYGLPKAISGHQNYYLWGPRGYTGEIMIVMDDDRETLEQLFESVEQVGVVDHPLAMPYERQKPVHLCRRIKVPLDQLWPKIRKWI
jgi:hypothetical protein